MSGGSRGTSGSSKKVDLGGDGELVSSLPSFSGVISRSWRPESSSQNTTMVRSRGSKAVLKKLNWATGQTLTPIGLEPVFQRSNQAVDSLQRCQNRDRGCPEVTYSTGSAHSAKNDVEGLPYAGKKFLEIADGFP